VKAQPETNETKLYPVSAEAHGKGIVRGCGRDSRRKAKGQKHPPQWALSRKAYECKLPLQQQVQLAAGKARENRAPTVQVYPKPRGIGEPVDGPTGKRRWSEFSHHVSDQQRNYTKRQARPRILLGKRLKFAPKGIIFAMGEYMAAKLEQVRCAREVAAYVLEQVQSLSQKKVGR
jgi:hypothetical protein